MQVVGVAALLALLALCEGLAVVKEGPLKKHDRKKDSLASSTDLKEDKKEASVLRLTGQPLVPKRDNVKDAKTDVKDDKTVVMDAKTDVIGAKTDVIDAKTDVIGAKTDVIDAKIGIVRAKDDVTSITKSAASKDEEVSLRVRQQLHHSERLGGETKAKQNTESELALAKTASDDPQSKAVTLGTATITFGNPATALPGLADLAALPALTFEKLGNLFSLGPGGIGGGVGGLPAITILGVSLNDIIAAIGGAGLPTALFGALAAIGLALAAALKALLLFIIPGLQIANQVLAIIAISLLGAWVFGDKGEEDYYDTGYDSGTGYEDSGTGYSLSSSGGGYGESPGVVGSGTGYSSYSDYRRSALAQSPFDGYTNLFGQQQDLAANSIDGSGLDGLFAGSPILAAAGKPVVTGRSGRSMVSERLVKRVGRMVSDAIKKYSEIYGNDGKEGIEGAE